MENSVEAFHYHDITCQQAFRKLKRHIGPYEYDMNIYRGCAHQCVYCYAIYSQRYLEHQDFYHDIAIKSNIVDRLEKQLSSPRWNHQIINIGSVCDSYQPIEETRKIMPEIWKLLIRYKTPCVLSTKSDLILRDIEYIKELANITYVGIVSTITTLDEDLIRIIEPGAVSAKRRSAMLKRIREESNASVGIHMMPMMPYLSDDDKNMEELMKLSRDIQVDHVICGPLNLIGETRKSYFKMLENNFPQLVKKYEQIYHGAHLDRNYQKDMYTRLRVYQKKYDVSFDYMKKVREHFQKNTVEQLSLW